MHQRWSKLTVVYNTNSIKKEQVKCSSLHTFTLEVVYFKLFHFIGSDFSVPQVT